jgi:hypothetical protein
MIPKVFIGRNRGKTCPQRASSSGKYDLTGGVAWCASLCGSLLLPLSIIVPCKAGFKSPSEYRTDGDIGGSSMLSIHSDGRAYPLPMSSGIGLWNINPSGGCCSFGSESWKSFPFRRPSVFLFKSSEGVSA